MAYGDECAIYLTEIKVVPTSVADIFLEITSVGIDCGAGAEICGSAKRLLAQDRRLLEIFGQGPCRFGIFGSVLTSVEDVDAPGLITGDDIPCVYGG